jgi:fructose-6-phosphate aldolase 1
MRLFLDSIDEAALGELWPTGAYFGVTTNPLILARAGATPHDAVKRCRRLGVGRLFLQAAFGGREAIAQDARGLAGLFHGELWVKVPAVGEGIPAMPRLRDVGIRTAATAVLSLGQALLAGEAGADVIIPFVGRAEAAGIDAQRLLADVCRAARNAEARVLAASVKTEDHVRMALEAGCWAVTLPPELAASFASHPGARKILEQFVQAERGGEE